MFLLFSIVFNVDKLAFNDEMRNKCTFNNERMKRKIINDDRLSIDEYTFEDCDALKTIFVPARKADYYKNRLPNDLCELIVELPAEKKAKPAEKKTKK